MLGVVMLGASWTQGLVRKFLGWPGLDCLNFKPPVARSLVTLCVGWIAVCIHFLGFLHHITTSAFLILVEFVFVISARGFLRYITHEPAFRVGPG